MMGYAYIFFEDEAIYRICVWMSDTGDKSVV